MKDQIRSISEEALKEAKTSLTSESKDELEKAGQKLATASHTIAQKMYEEAAKKTGKQGADPGPETGKKDDGVVDADYEVVDEEEKKKKVEHQCTGETICRCFDLQLRSLTTKKTKAAGITIAALEDRWPCRVVGRRADGAGGAFGVVRAGDTLQARDVLVVDADASDAARLRREIGA